MEITKPKSKEQNKKKNKKKESKTKSKLENEAEDEEDFNDFFEKHCENQGTSQLSLNETISPFNEALSLDPSWLDANTELKKKFGGAVSGGNSVLGEINSRALRQNAALNKGIKRKPFKRKNGFITPRPFWPPFGPSETGLNVQLVKNGDDCEEFEIVEDEAYQSVFEELELLVRTGDLEFLIQLIHGQPLFVDGLLLLSDAYRMQSTGDAGEIVERALYILERIMPTNLSFLNGQVRFRYSHPGNRKLHLCLYRQILFTMKKGCWKVALQLAKALLALDPENDPLGSRLFIDFLALQSESFEDFDKLWVQLNHKCQLGPLPGWYFNRALRMFLDEEKTRNDHSASTEALTEAVLKSPGTARLLLQSLKCKIPDNFPNSGHFESDLAQVGAAKIFIARCNTLWKTPSAQKWFENEIIKLENNNSESSIDFRSVALINQVPIYRHSLLSDLSSLNVAIPTNVSSTSSLNAYDPLPSECFDDDGNEGESSKSILSGLRDLLISSFAARNN